jgi:hypothetical protein
MESNDNPPNENVPNISWRGVEIYSVEINII